MADILIIGGGHNALAAAALLAKAGRRVLLLERRPMLGGAAAAEEFAPGYRSPGLLNDTSTLRPELVEQLDLPRHGLRRAAAPPAVLAIDPRAADAGGLLLAHDPEIAADEIARHNPADAAAYRAERGFWREVRPLVAPLLAELPPDPGNLEWTRLAALAPRLWPLRRLGGRRLMELLRLGPLSVQDFVCERYAAPLLRAARAAQALVGDRWGPRAPGTNAQLVLHELTARGSVAGGPAAVVAALVAAARQHGAELRTGVTVEQILLESAGHSDRRRAVGVRLAGGEEVRAATILAACGPRTVLLDLLPPRTLPPAAEDRLRQFRARGAAAVLRLALRGRLEFSGRPGQRIEFARLAGSLDDWERAADAVKYRQLAERPALDLAVPTVSDPSLAPEGGDVVNVIIHGAPHDLDGGWTTAARQTLLERTLALLADATSALRDRVVAHELLTPADLEARYRLPGGHLLHGEQSLDQWLVRPTPDCGRYGTPIAGLYLTGGGTWLGGRLSGAAGMLAARRILQRA